MSELVGRIHYEVALDTAKMVDGQRAVERAVDKAAASFNTITQAVKLYAAALAVVKAINLADEMRLLGARVEVAAGGLEKGAAALRELEAISKRTQTSVEANAAVFARLNQSLLQMGGTQSDTLRLTELLGKAIKVSGASAVEAKAAMLQFGQALGSGKLAGDELRSLLENAPYLMRQLAQGLGVPIGSLKDLGEQGKLTADAVVNALSKAADTIEADFQKFPKTFEGAVQVVQDGARRAAESLDTVSGASAAATGAAQGLGEIIDALAKQFAGAAGEQDNLSRNSTIKTWADNTATALSYVVDAGDLVWQTLSVLGRNVGFVFTGMGAEIRGIFEQAKALARGDLAEVEAISGRMKAMAALRRKELDDADAATLGRRQLAGQRFREERAALALTPEPDRLDLAGRRKPAPSRLKPPPGGGGSGSKFDAANYLAGLAEKAASEWERIGIVEQEALRKNEALFAQGKLTRKQYEEAATLISQAAAEKRLDIQLENAEKVRQAIAEGGKQEAEERRKAQEYATQLIRAINPIDALRQEYEAKLELVRQYEQMIAATGVDATEQGQIARTQITREYEAQRLALAEQAFRSQGDAQAFLIDSINALSSSAAGAISGLITGTMTASDVMRSFANVILNEAVKGLVQIGVQQVKNAILGDTLAAAKGAAYTASVSAQVAGMSALAAQNAFAATAAIPIIGPALAPAAAAAAAAAAGALGSPAIATAPVAGARRYGGPVTAGQLYRVNEGGQAEMFTAANGAQYMLPTANGSVTPAGDLASGVEWRVIVNNNAPGAQASASVNRELRIVEIAVMAVAEQISERTGPVWGAMRTTNVQARF